ncbi:MAG: hypothetical protein PVJ30_02155 [Thiohalocapsa sp.]|jgi:hypothetical protein
MNLRRLSGLARPVDTAYASNRRILGLSAAVLVAAWLIFGLHTGSWLAALGSAALAALACFLAWALARELDPDQSDAAVLGAALSLPGLLAAGLPDIGALFLVLLAVRAVNRSTGLPATVLDLGLLLALGVLISLPAQPVYLAAAGVAVLLDGILAPPSRRRLITGIGAATIAAAVVIVLMPEGPRPLPDLTAVLAALALAALFIPVVLAQIGIESTADETGEPLSTKRVQAGQLLALAAALAAAFWQGGAGLTALSPLWAAMLAAAGWRLWGRVRGAGTV